MNKLIKQLKETNPKLNDFLVSRRLRSAFLRNYKNYPFDYQIDYQNLKKDGINSFEWRRTPEGTNFWYKIYNEYLEYLLTK